MSRTASLSGAEGDAVLTNRSDRGRASPLAILWRERRSLFAWSKGIFGALGALVLVLGLIFDEPQEALRLAGTSALTAMPLVALVFVTRSFWRAAPGQRFNTWWRRLFALLLLILFLGLALLLGFGWFGPWSLSRPVWSQARSVFWCSSPVLNVTLDPSQPFVDKEFELVVRTGTSSEQVTQAWTEVTWRSVSSVGVLEDERLDGGNRRATATYTPGAVGVHTLGVRVVNSCGRSSDVLVPFTVFERP